VGRPAWKSVYELNAILRIYVSCCHDFFHFITFADYETCNVYIMTQLFLWNK